MHAHIHSHILTHTHVRSCTHSSAHTHKIVRTLPNVEDRERTEKAILYPFVVKGVARSYGGGQSTVFRREPM